MALSEGLERFIERFSVNLTDPISWPDRIADMHFTLITRSLTLLFSVELCNRRFLLQAMVSLKHNQARVAIAFGYIHANPSKTGRIASGANYWPGLGKLYTEAPSPLLKIASFTHELCLRASHLRGRR